MLSKRWRYLWTSVSNIEVNDSPLNWSPRDDCCPLRKLHFLNFVDNLIFRHDTSNIEKLNLSFHCPIEQSHVNAWMSALLKHRIQELVLSLSDFSSYVFCSSLFNSETLTVLKLSYCSLNIPVGSRFRNLRTCHFSNVTFLNDESTPCFIPNSPVLEELFFDECSWKKSTTFIIDIPSLKKFKLVFDEQHDSLEIHAPHLEFLKLCGWNFHGNFLLRDSSVPKVCVDFSLWEMSSERKAEYAMEIFEAIRMVESLKINESILSAFSLVEHLHLVNNLHMHNLTHLKVLLYYCIVDGTDIINMLLRSPKVESLYIDACRHDYNDEYFWFNDKWMGYSAPSSFKPALKQITIDGFRGNVAEAHLLKILLKHAGCLESIQLNCRTPLSKEVEKLQRIKNKLMMLPRASINCVIDIC